MEGLILFCEKCGTRIKEGRNFCSNCGAHVEHETKIEEIQKKRSFFKTRYFSVFAFMVLSVVVGDLVHKMLQ